MARPIYERMAVEDGAIRLFFTHLAGGLVSASGKELQGFEIADEDRQFRAATATITGDTVLVRAANVPEPRFARYGWANHRVCTLYNRARLPALPFRTHPE